MTTNAVATIVSSIKDNNSSTDRQKKMVASLQPLIASGGAYSCCISVESWPLTCEAGRISPRDIGVSLELLEAMSVASADYAR
jgi:hypothetical protein